MYEIYNKTEQTGAILKLPGDLVTSLHETGEKTLLPYPIRQTARSLHLQSMLERMMMLSRIILSYTTIGTRNYVVKMRSVDFDSWEVPFSSTANLFYTWMVAIQVELHNMQLAASY